MYGLLIYDHKGIARNRRFIDRLLTCASDTGEELRLVEAEKLFPGVLSGALSFDFPDGRKPDYAIVRTIFPLLSEILENCGVVTVNNARVSSVANDKRRTAALCASLGVKTPDTVFLNKNCFDPEAFSYPQILKSADGHGGNEVFYVENPKSAALAVESLNSAEFLLQKPVDKGRDVRLYMLNGRLLAAVERRSHGDFRSNFSLGGECTLFTPSPGMMRDAERLCGALQPVFIGVDFIFDHGEPLLNEIEDAVGARMLYKLTDLPVHRLFYDAVISSVLSKIK